MKVEAKDLLILFCFECRRQNKDLDHRDEIRAMTAPCAAKASVNLFMLRNVVHMISECMIMMCLHSHNLSRPKGIFMMVEA